MGEGRSDSRRLRKDQSADKDGGTDSGNVNQE